MKRLLKAASVFTLLLFMAGGFKGCQYWHGDPSGPPVHNTESRA